MTCDSSDLCFITMPVKFLVYLQLRWEGEKINNAAYHFVQEIGSEHFTSNILSICFYAAITIIMKKVHYRVKL